MQTKLQNSLEEIKKEVLSIGEGLYEANKCVLEALHHCEVSKFEEARTHIKNIGVKSSSIDISIIEVLSYASLQKIELKELIALMKITNELSRASSNTRSFVRGFSAICEDIDVATIREFALPMQRATVQAIQETLEMIQCDCNEEMEEIFHNVLIEESKADDLYELVERNLYTNAEDIKSFEKFHRLLKALRKSAKITARAVSIANLIIYSRFDKNLYN